MYIIEKSVIEDRIKELIVEKDIPRIEIDDYYHCLGALNELKELQSKAKEVEISTIADIYTKYYNDEYYLSISFEAWLRKQNYQLFK
jgi:hypothetical protein